MIRNRTFTQLLLSASAVCFAACASGAYDDQKQDDADGLREGAVETLQAKAGAPVTVEIQDGVTRVLQTSPRFNLATHASDPVAAAKGFLAENAAAFKLSAEDAASFVATRTDLDRASGSRHVILNRTFNGTPVFQGAIGVHMDSGNNVFRATGDEFYQIATPTNREMLSATEAAIAAGRQVGVTLAPSIASSDDLTTILTAANTLDPINVSKRIFQVAPGDNRLAYQTTISYKDATGKQQYDLVVVDAQDGTALHVSSLVNEFTGRVFTASPGASPTTDTRTVVSFNGNPAASPQGWVGAARKTIGNNVISATDLNGNNAVGTNETQPTADANDAFDFPFSPLQNASNFKEAAVTNAFFFANDWHDREYALGFTESAGNFQTSNFGNGGAQNDEVQQDVQDGSGSNNANFATPPDGSKPRMQMFLFTINGGAQEDGDFDATVVYHENTHGLSNRLVGGGSGACLGGTQSGSMGEGWSDFVAASFLNDPVIGAYVTGNATVGIREFSMANSPLTYAQMKDGSHAEVHAGGEIWAATLWSIRNVIGAAKIDQLVTAGMKLTPCNPTMLQARDAILQADVNINAGANRCAIFSAFAARQMGTGASSPNHNSTSAIVLSTAVPAECGGGGGTGVTRDFISTDVPKAIPDNNATGVRSNITVPAGHDITKVTVDANITHTFRGDLVIQAVGPAGQTFTLSNRAGGSADNFVATGTDITSAFAAGAQSGGTWQLFVRDLARIDTGSITNFRVHITSSN